MKTFLNQKTKVIISTAFLIIISTSFSFTQNYIKSKEGCFIWNPHPIPNETVSWSGECFNGYGDGIGVVKWYQNGQLNQEYRCRLSKGVKVGEEFWIRYHQEYNYDNWFEALILCFERRPYQDDLAQKLIYTYPGNSFVYANNVKLQKAVGAFVYLFGAANNKDDTKNFAEEYLLTDSPFMAWYFRMVKDNLDNQTINALRIEMGLD